jgi:hypothetical protein
LTSPLGLETSAIKGNVHRLVRSGLSDSAWFHRAAAQTIDEFPGRQPEKSNFSRAQTTMDQGTG